MMTVSNSLILRTVPLLIAVCLISFPAYAKYGGGTRGPNDPYQIATAADGSFWCGQGCDLTDDGSVDFHDLKEFAQNWLAALSP